MCMCVCLTQKTLSSDTSFSIIFFLFSWGKKKRMSHTVFSFVPLSFFLLFLTFFLFLYSKQLTHCLLLSLFIALTSTT